MKRIYRFTSDGLGIYEAVERHCPRTDPRRKRKPDGSWLPKVGADFPGAISFWKKAGLNKYQECGLRDWHESVCPASPEILISGMPQEILYQDELQVICKPEAAKPFRIRFARPEDARGIAEVHVQAWNETYKGLMPEEFLKSRTVQEKIPQWQSAIAQSCEPNAKKRLWVAEDTNGRIIGMNIGGEARDASFGYDSELYAIYILRKYQDLGIGALLFRELVRWLKFKGHQKMMLWMLDGNPTFQFYERIGGTKLPQIKEVDHGGTRFRDIAYGWSLKE